jgi:hypothetical protein
MFVLLFVEVIFKAMSESAFDRFKKEAKEFFLLQVRKNKLKEKNKFGSQEPFKSSHLPHERQLKRKNGPWNNKNKIEI